MPPKSILLASQLMIDAGAAVAQGDFDRALSLKEQAEKVEPRLSGAAKIMTAFELIQRAAAVLYSDTQVAMARDLGVTTRTVYRWLHGQPTPAPKIFVTLLERLDTRLDELDSLGAEVKEYLLREIRSKPSAPPGPGALPVQMRTRTRAREDVPDRRAGPE